MSMRDKNDKLTICEVLRMVNDRLQMAEHEGIRDLLALAEQMAKKMAKKLVEYNERFDSEWWINNPQYKKMCERELSRYLTGDATRALLEIGRSEG